MDFLAVTRALRRVGYSGDVIFECTAAGPDPFTPVKGDGWLAEVRRYTQESLQLVKTYVELTMPGSEASS